MTGITASVGSSSVCKEKFGTYVSYKVISESNKAGFRPGNITVDRRYSDFVWLQGEFSREFPGCILPPLPDKNAMSRNTPDFIEGRRRSLERYLQRVVSHLELNSSPLLIIFLQSDEAAFSRAKDDSKANKPKLTTTAVSWFEGTVNSFANGKPELEKSAADIKIEEMLQYVTKLEKQLSSAVKHADGMTRKLKDTSTAMFEFGQSLNFLGQSEGDAVGTALVQLGSTIETLSNCYLTQAEDEIARFMEPIDDYARMMSSVKNAIQQRQDKKNNYLLALSDVEAKVTTLKKTQGVAGKEALVQQKEQAVRAAEESRDAAKADYEHVTDRLMSEFDIFRARKAVDLKEIMNSFVEIQIEHHKRVESIWQEVIPKLNNLPLPEGLLSQESDVSSPSPASTTQHHQHPHHHHQSNFRDEDDEEYSGV